MVPAYPRAASGKRRARVRATITGTRIGIGVATGMARAGSTSHKQRKRVRKVLAGAVLFFLGRGLVAAARLDRRVKREIASWPDPTVVTIAIAPDGPRACWRYADGHLSHIAPSEAVSPTLLVTYKSVDVALPVLTGQQGILDAVTQHRSTLAGDIGLGMSLVRCLHVVESYLFPDIIGARILPEPPAREVPQLLAYAHLWSTAVSIEEAS